MAKLIEGDTKTRAAAAVELVRKGAPLTHAAKAARVAVPTMWQLFPGKLATALDSKATARKRPNAKRRRAAMKALSTLGWKQTEIAAAWGVTPQYVSEQLKK